MPNLFARGGFREGAHGLNPLANQRFPLWYYFMTSIFGQTALKIFYARQYILVLKESARRKNATFWAKFSNKCSKNGIFDPFFQKFACSAKFVKIGSLYCSRSARKVNRPASPPPPIEKILDQPLLSTTPRMK